MDANVGFLLIPILGSILVVAFFSSSEAALISVNKFRIRHLAEQGSSSAKTVSRVLARHERFFATILLTENAFIILASVLAERLASDLLGDSGLSILIATVVMTTLIVALGEITPKTLSAQRAVGWSLLVARPIELIMALETWVIVGFTLLPRLLIRMTSGGAARAPTITEGELGMLIDIGEAEGVVGSGGAEVLRRVLDFGDRQVRDVMTPRTQIVWVEQGTSIREFLATYGEKYHTRFPVYRGDPDAVIGIVTVKDVMRAFAQGGSLDDSATATMRNAYFVPETKLAQALFAEMRTHGHQLAMVSDEFGSVAGLVTLKQLIQGIVGRVEDEEEVHVEELITLAPNAFEIDPRLPIAEANERLGLSLAYGRYKSVAGLILEQLRRVPVPDDEVVVGDVHFRVIEMRGARIARVVVTHAPAEGETPAPPSA